MSDEKRSVRWYETAYIVVLIGVLALSMTYLRPHRIGVINMDQAFKSLGVADRMAAAMKEKEGKAQARFAELQKEASRQEKEILASFKAAQTDEQKAKVQADFTVYQTRMQRSRAEIAGELQRFQRDVVMSFRERLRAHVQKVASKKRVDIVIEPEQVFQIMNNAVDLTEPVVGDARADFSPDKALIDEALLKSRNLWIEDEKPETGKTSP